MTHEGLNAALLVTSTGFVVTLKRQPRDVEKGIGYERQRTAG